VKIFTIKHDEYKLDSEIYSLWPVIMVVRRSDLNAVILSLWCWVVVLWERDPTIKYEPMAFYQKQAKTIAVNTAYGYRVFDMEVMPDHIHLVRDVNPQIGIVRIIGKIKGYSAHILRKEFKWLRSRLPCLWTRSKFVSTVGAVTLDVVKKYIEDQKGK